MPYAMPLRATRPHSRAGFAPADFPSAKPSTHPSSQADDGLDVHAHPSCRSARARGAKLPAVIFMHGSRAGELLGGITCTTTKRLRSISPSRAGHAVLSVNFRSGWLARGFRMAPKRGASASEYHMYSPPRATPVRDTSTTSASGSGLLVTRTDALGLARTQTSCLGRRHARRTDCSGASRRDLYRLQPARAEIAFEASPASPSRIGARRAAHPRATTQRLLSQLNLARRLREQSVEFEQIVFPDDVHDFLLHRHWLRAYAAAADFFDRHLKGQKR